MAGGKTDAKLGAMRRGQECDRGGRRDSDPDDIHARACQPGDDRRFEELARRARIAPDDRDGSRDITTWLDEDLGGRDCQFDCQRGT